MCRIEVVKRVQIHLEEELDRSAAAEAARRGISKAALIRATLARELASSSPRQAEQAGWADMTGWLDVEPVDDIDEVVYGEDH